MMGTLGDPKKKWRNKVSLSKAMELLIATWSNVIMNVLKKVRAVKLYNVKYAIHGYMLCMMD